MNTWEILFALDEVSDADLESVGARLGLTQRPRRRTGMRVLLAAAVAAALLIATLGVAMAANPDFRDAIYSIFHIQTREPMAEAAEVTDENVQLWKHLELEDAAEIDYYTVRIPYMPVAEDTLYHWDETGGVFYHLTEKGFEEIPGTRVETDVAFGGATQHIVYDWAKVNGQYVLGYREDPRMNENPYGYAWMLHQPDPTSPTVWLTLPDWSKSFAPCPFLLDLETGAWTDVLQGMEYGRFDEERMPSWRFSPDMQHLLLTDDCGGAWLYDTNAQTETDLSLEGSQALLDADFPDADTIVLMTVDNQIYSFTWYHLKDGTLEQRSYPSDAEGPGLRSVLTPVASRGILLNADGTLSLTDLQTGIGAQLPAFDRDCVYLLNGDGTQMLCVDRRLSDSGSDGLLTQTFTGFSVCDLENHTVVRLDRETSDDASEWSVFWLDNQRFAVWAENPAEGFGDIHVYHLHAPA